MNLRRFLLPGISALLFEAATLPIHAQSANQTLPNPVTGQNQPLNQVILTPPANSANPVQPFEPLGTKISVTTFSTQKQLVIAKLRYSGGDWSVGDTVSDKNEITDGVVVRLAKALTDSTTHVIPSTHAVVAPFAFPYPPPMKDDYKMRPSVLILTGSKDFTFTDDEVLALQKYLVEGGALWIDSFADGKGSAFDKAVRREMARVLNGADEKFLETKLDAFGEQLWPNGVETISLDGTVSVLYATNGILRKLTKPYSDELTPAEKADYQKGTALLKWLLQRMDKDAAHFQFEPLRLK
jgi:hypothetical protein